MDDELLETSRERLSEETPSLRVLFDRVVGEEPFVRLPDEELIDVLAAPTAEKRDLVIGGSVDEKSGTAVLVRGTLDALLVPLSMFAATPRSKPDSSRLSFRDYGNTIAFGEYEAAVDAVLWEVDADFRKRAKAGERNVAQGFGASLRRLRLQRGLSQSDFPGITRRTISRLENGEVAKPHGATLDAIADRLGVGPEMIETY
ncbi:helix-turn-helix protein [Planctomycetes bacterium Pan216]|uniref:Helix-turn-helix protein n=1 Tax=Kolteria novifilia TaxID=2527975 RepID=A0A518AXS0_9BACT|nr:helix-turn-helix protein [Planctomycetes bacterium Pan216]